MIESVKQVSSFGKSAGLESLSSLNETLSTSAHVAPSSAAGTSFASMLGELSLGAVNNLKQAEIASFEGIQGKATTREVVDAVLSAEQSLQTAIALRDKIVNAYLEITKMQI